MALEQCDRAVVLHVPGMQLAACSPAREAAQPTSLQSGLRRNCPMEAIYLIGPSVESCDIV